MLACRVWCMFCEIKTDNERSAVPRHALSTLPGNWCNLAAELSSSCYYDESNCTSYQTDKESMARVTIFWHKNFASPLSVLRPEKQVLTWWSTRAAQLWKIAQIFEHTQGKFRIKYYTTDRFCRHIGHHRDSHLEWMDGRFEPIRWDCYRVCVKH